MGTPSCLKGERFSENYRSNQHTMLLINALKHGDFGFIHGPYN